MPEANGWTRTKSPFIAAADSEAMCWTGAMADGTRCVLYVDRAITADHAFVTVAVVANPDDAQAVFAAVDDAPQIVVPLSALTYLGQHLADAMRQELGDGS